MPSTPSSRLGLQAPLTTENADGPSLAQLLIDGLEASVGMAKLASLTPSGGSYNIDLTPWSAATFRHLRVVINARGAVAGPGQVLAVRFNGDSTSGHYDYARSSADSGNTGGPAGGNASGTYLGLGGINRETAVFSAHAADILDYRSANHKLVRSKGIHVVSNVIALQDMSGRWNQTSAITSIQVLNSAGSGLDVASVLDLYGVI